MNPFRALPGQGTTLVACVGVLLVSVAFYFTLLALEKWGRQ